MKNSMWTKGFVLGIIILFLGAGVLPSISGDIEKKFTFMGKVENQIDNNLKYNDEVYKQCNCESTMNETCKNGNGWDRIEGDVQVWENIAIRVSKGDQSGVAYYTFCANCTYGINLDAALVVGVEQKDWGVTGDGCDVFVKNQITGLYDRFIQNAGSNDDYMWKWTSGSTLARDYVNNNCLDIKVYADGHDDSIVRTICVRYTCNPPQIKIPKLNCVGQITFTEVKAGAHTLHGEFRVENIGDPGSNLNWLISEWPNWGTWMFNPSSGTHLQPKDGQIKVAVDITIIGKPYDSFSGDIKVVNTDNSDDSDSVQVAISFPTNKNVYMNPLFQKLLDQLGISIDIPSL